MYNRPPLDAAQQNERTHWRSLAGGMQSNRGGLIATKEASGGTKDRIGNFRGDVGGKMIVKGFNSQEILRSSWEIRHHSYSRQIFVENKAYMDLSTTSITAKFADFVRWLGKSEPEGRVRYGRGSATDFKERRAERNWVFFSENR